MHYGPKSTTYVSIKKIEDKKFDPVRRPPSVRRPSKKQSLTLDPVGKLLRSTLWPIFFENSEQRKLGYVLGFLPKHREIPNKIEARQFGQILDLFEYVTKR